LLGCIDFIGGQGYLTPTETRPLRWPTFSLPPPSSRPLFIFGCGARNGRTVFSIHCSRARAWTSRREFWSASRPRPQCHRRANKSGLIVSAVGPYSQDGSNPAP